MCNSARFDRHARLVARMADALGTDIETSVQSGRILPEELDIFTFNCMGCPQPDACEQWLDGQDGVAAAAPHYCRNREALEALVQS